MDAKKLELSFLLALVCALAPDFCYTVRSVDIVGGDFDRYLCFGAVSRSARAHASPSQSIMLSTETDNSITQSLMGSAPSFFAPRGDWFPNFLGNDLPTCCVEKIAWQVTPPATPTNLPSKFSPVGPPRRGFIFSRESEPRRLSTRS